MGGKARKTGKDRQAWEGRAGGQEKGQAGEESGGREAEEGIVCYSEK